MNSDSHISRARQIRDKFIAEHPSAKDEMRKAFFAYHISHFRENPTAHNFTSLSREASCIWCSRTRVDVRFDDLPPECQKRPTIPDIEECILGEEQKAFALIARAERHIPLLLKKNGGIIDGKFIAVLHHTHGYPLEVSESVLSIPPVVAAEYEEEMRKERLLSKDAFRPKEIRVVQ